MPNKRTGPDYLDKKQLKKQKQGWEDLRKRIKKDKESRKDRTKTLPYKI